MASGDRYFLIGETVHLRARVSLPGTRTPTTATVTLASLKRDGTVITPATTAFTEVHEGDYTYVLATVGFTAGTYDVLVRVASGTSKVMLLSDKFVLRAAP